MITGLPKGFVEEWTEKGKGSTIFGIRIEDLTKEELFAVAVAGWHGWKQQTLQSIKTFEKLGKS